jgi:O-antigen/teichoic acid export membrane protein
VLIARVGGPEARGLYALFVAVTALLGPCLSLGLPQAVTQSVARGEGLDRVRALSAGYVLLLTALFVLPAAVALRWAWGSGGHALVAVAAAASLPCIVGAELARGRFLGERRTVAWNSVQLAIVALLLPANALLLPRGDRFVLVAVWLTYTLPLLPSLLGDCAALLRGPRPDRAWLTSALRFGVRAALAAILDAAILRADVLAMSVAVAVEDVGVYSIADQISHILAWGGLIAGRVMFARASADAGTDGARRRLGLSVRVVLAGSTVAAVVVAAASPMLVPAIFGASFGAAALPIALLVPATVAKGAVALLAGYLLGVGRTRPVLRAGLVALSIEAVGALLVALLLPWQAVAAVKSLAYVAQAAVLLGAVREDSGPLPLWFAAADLAALATWLRARRRRPS